MAITQLLTRTDGSAGREKVDRRPPPNRSHFWPADELNKVLDWCVAASEALGLSDGTTVDSIIAKLRSVGSPRGTRTVLFDDFLVSADLYTGTTAAGGSAGMTQLSSAGSGVGQARVAHANGVGSTGRLRTDNETICGAHLPDKRFKFQAPNTLSGCNFHIGVENIAGTSYARFRCNAGAAIRMQAASATGAGSVDTSVGVVPVANTWYEGRIRFTESAIEFYLNDVLVGTISTANAIPVAADALCPFNIYIEYVAASTNSLNVDWYEASLLRL